MSTQFLLDEDDIEELAKLMLVMIETQESRKQLCRELGINPHEVSFLRDTSDDTFCTELIDCLNQYGYKEYLCKLCCQKLFPILNKSVYNHRISNLENIIEKLNCNQEYSPTPSPLPEVGINPLLQPDTSKHQSLLKIISDHKKKFFAVAAILVFVLLGYPAYKAYKAFNPSKILVTSLLNGNLPEYKQGNIPVESTNVNLRNFIVEAQFHNPYDGAIDNWTYGFSFKEDLNSQDNPNGNLNDSRNKTFDIWIISKNKKWGFTSSNRGVIEGNLTNIDVSNNGSNKLRLIVQDKQAIFYVNDILVQTFDISNFSQKGNVFLIAKNGISGKHIQYQNLNVWSLDN